MSADFPFVIDRIALTDNWSLHLPFACKLRIEDGAMVIWRPGFTIWLNAWNNDAGESISARKAHFAQKSDTGGFDEREHTDAGRLYYSYRLAEEADDERVPAVYGFSFANDGHLQLSFYFDDEDDAQLAYQILASASDAPATLSDRSIYSQLCFATNMIIEDGLPVAYMYRESPDNPADSGWRFFSGQESQDYVDNPDNTRVLPIALVAQTTPEIIPHLLAAVNTQWERGEKGFVPV